MNRLLLRYATIALTASSFRYADPSQSFSRNRNSAERSNDSGAPSTAFIMKLGAELHVLTQAQDAPADEEVMALLLRSVTTVPPASDSKRS